jgi:outer membrane murein-binding lipoprotein Lpp
VASPRWPAPIQAGDNVRDWLNDLRGVVQALAANVESLRPEIDGMRDDHTQLKTTVADLTAQVDRIETPAV